MQPSVKESHHCQHFGGFSSQLREHRSGNLGHFLSFLRWPQVSHLHYLVSTLIRGEDLVSMPATCRRRSHTRVPSNISRGRRKGCMNHPDRSRMERDIPPLSPHTHAHCQRFMVQGFNGALTHLFLSVYLSPLSHSHTNTHRSVINLPSPPLFLSPSSPPSSLYLLSISLLP